MHCKGGVAYSVKGWGVHCKGAGVYCKGGVACSVKGWDVYCGVGGRVV